MIVRDVLPEHLLVEPHTAVRTGAGTNVTFRCESVILGRPMTSCRWIFFGSNSSIVSLLGGNWTRSRDTDSVEPPEVSLTENGTACLLRLSAVGPRDVGRYLCADLLSDALSNVAKLELDFSAAPIASGPATDPHSTLPSDIPIQEICNDGGSSKDHVYRDVIAGVVGGVLLLISTLLAGVACYYYRQIRRIRREDSKMDLDFIRMKAQAAALQKETELMTNTGGTTRGDERYLTT
ncbi:uncharacterized protein LOC110977822 [Acanthaster planci]|uniref:Uncharacterized protein LOC110977822 n=1 Tax=Acanthaster planci TaxID=133434 RepID=A0A8B7Y461_ACAPL|nr:uncharacterized protein LOC110977822 [Acanthaster planci]